MQYSQEIYRAIKDFLDADDLHYSFDEEKAIFKCGVNMKNKLQETKLLILPREKRYIVYATINMNADEASRPEVARLLNMINYNSVYGDFEMDERDGEIRYKLATNCENCTPSRSVVQASVVIPAKMFIAYGDTILVVMMGFKDAKTAYADYKAAHED